jgi:hypothetical protein
VKALHLRRLLQDAPPSDVEVVRRHLKDFKPSGGELTMRIRLARRKADVFKPRPHSRELYRERMTTERERFRHHHDSVRRAMLEVADRAVATHCHLRIEFQLSVGLTWSEALKQRALFARRVRERYKRAGQRQPVMFVIIRALEGVPAKLTVLTNELVDNLEMMLEAGPRRSPDSEVSGG